jgi:hypothetical protein
MRPMICDGVVCPPANPLRCANIAASTTRPIVILPKLPLMDLPPPLSSFFRVAERERNYPLKVPRPPLSAGEFLCCRAINPFLDPPPPPRGSTATLQFFVQGLVRGAPTDPARRKVGWCMEYRPCFPIR